MPGGRAILNKGVREASMQQRLGGRSRPGARGGGKAGAGSRGWALPHVIRAEAGHQFPPQVLALAEWPRPLVTHTTSFHSSPSPVLRPPVSSAASSPSGHVSELNPLSLRDLRLFLLS